MTFLNFLKLEKRITTLKPIRTDDLVIEKISLVYETCILYNQEHNIRSQNYFFKNIMYVKSAVTV